MIHQTITKQTKLKIMTTLQLIHNDTSEAIYKLINTKDLYKKFIEIKKSLPLSKVFTTKDLNEQSIKALLIMIDNGFIK